LDNAAGWCPERKGAAALLLPTVASRSYLLTGRLRLPERFRAKWVPVRVKKTRQTKD
jgi:hypothetical protein